MTCHPPSSARSSTPYRRLRIAELRSGDTATVLAIFQGMSAHSRFQRFHTGQPVLSHRMLRRLVDVDPERHVAHVALVGNRPVGLVRWIRLQDRARTAELALEVVDDAHGHGIGRALVGVAARSAHQAGVQDFMAYVAPGNRAVLEWARGRGAVADLADDAVLRRPVVSLLPARRRLPVLIRWPSGGSNGPDRRGRAKR
jgi:GNAT superfamily N-acetyltransferase